MSLEIKESYSVYLQNPPFGSEFRLLRYRFNLKHFRLLFLWQVDILIPTKDRNCLTIMDVIAFFSDMFPTTWKSLISWMLFRKKWILFGKLRMLFLITRILFLEKAHILLLDSIFIWMFVLRLWIIFLIDYWIIPIVDIIRYRFFLSLNPNQDVILLRFQYDSSDSYRIVFFWLLLLGRSFQTFNT